MSVPRLAALCLALAACDSKPPADAKPPVGGEGAGAKPTEPAPAETPPPEPEPDPEPEVPGGGPDPLTLAADYSTSIGSPTEGTLSGGVPVPLHGPGYRFSPIKNEASRYGTVELVQALIRSAAVVHETLPGNRITFGDLARESGGDIPGHASHRSGRDVDIYFYYLDEDDEPFEGKAIPLDTEGKGVDFGDLTDPNDDVAVHIDVPRTWRFVQELLSQEDLAVGRIFVVEHIRSMLLAEAAEQGAPKDVVQLFSDVTCQPRAPHDDHLHVRVFCTAQDIGEDCQDTRPIFPWHKKRLKKAGVAAVIATRSKKKKKKKKKTKGIAQARAEAGEMHEDVTAFLDRRNAWAKKPKVGRTYCK
ncbi:MAG: penicillin-insensitive murein endopeptidase [Myxococcota bacterium]